MSCETMIGSIVALLDGELPDEERRSLERHLAGCRSCSRERELLEETRGLVSARLRAVVVGPSFDRVWQQIEADEPVARRTSLGRRGGGTTREPGRLRTSTRRRGLWWAGAASGMALAAGLALTLLRPGALEDSGPDRPGSPAKVASVPAKQSAPPIAVAAKPEPKPATKVAKRDPAPEQSEHGEQRVARNEPAPVVEEAAPEAVAVAEPELPRDLLERPELFLNYSIVRKLDEMRHLDAVLADSPAADAPDDGGAG